MLSLLILLFFYKTLIITILRTVKNSVHNSTMTDKMLCLFNKFTPQNNDISNIIFYNNSVYSEKSKARYSHLKVDILNLRETFLNFSIEWFKCISVVALLKL